MRRALGLWFVVAVITPNADSGFLTGAAYTPARHFAGVAVSGSTCDVIAPRVFDGDTCDGQLGGGRGHAILHRVGLGGSVG